MDLPIKFPNRADVIAEEAERFFRLSPMDKVKTIQKCIDDFQLTLRMTGREAEFLRHAEEEERLGRVAIFEFAARYHANQLSREFPLIDECGTPDTPIIVEPAFTQSS